jgi:hypothetical protein
MDFKLAKKLYKFGFRKKTLLVCYFWKPMGNPKGKWFIDTRKNFEKFCFTSDGSYIEGISYFPYPILEELIDACGDRFYKLKKTISGWKARGSRGKAFDCSKCKSRILPIITEISKTPREAVANLWIGLNRKIKNKTV